MTVMEQMGVKAKEAAAVLSVAGSKKETALSAAADALIKNTDAILSENAKDLKNGEAAGLTQSLLDRLRLTPQRIQGMADGMRSVAHSADPIGQIISGSTLKNGLLVKKVRVPLGVIGIIFEARPNVTADAAALCLKSGNAAILRGGSEAIHCNRAIARLIQESLAAAGLPAEAVQVVDTTDRAAVGELITLR